MTEFLNLLRQLMPLWAALLVFGFGYLVVLIKKASDRFLDIATKQADYLRDRVDVVDKSTGIFTRAIEQQEKEIKQLNEQVNRLSSGVQATRETEARLSIQELTVISGSIEQLTVKQEQLFELIEQNTGHRPEAEADHLKRQVDGNQISGEIVRAMKARDLSIFPILICKLPGTDDLIEQLRHKGYAASLYRSHDEESDPDEDGDENEQVGAPKDHEAIWVGEKIPPSYAVEIIQIARSHWPYLKYVHLSSDSEGPDYTHFQMFLGGSTYSATEMLKCTPWSDADFKSLSADMTTEEFHKLIQGYYAA